MKKARTMEETVENDDVFDDVELSATENRERILVIKATPRSRRAQLLAHGAKNIRCSCCFRVSSLVSAVEFQDGWLCEKCASDMGQKPNHFSEENAIL